MIDIRIYGQTQVDRLKHSFRQLAGVDINVYWWDKKEEACGFSRLSEIRNSKSKGEPVVSFQRNAKVEMIINRFKEAGIKVKILEPKVGGKKPRTIATDIQIGKLSERYISKKESELLDALEESPLFQLSLSSKELFHSNFIYWLGEKNKVILSKIIKKWVGLRGRGEVEIIDIRRESKYLDLVIAYRKSPEPDEEYILIIENKVKSIPSVKQLDDYTKKHLKRDGDKGILLTFSPLAVDVEKWNQILYGDFLDDIMSLEGKSKGYNHQLIKDYCDFSMALFKLLNGLEKYDNYFIKEELLGRLKQLRIHDLFLKHQASQLAHELIDVLKKDSSIRAKIGEPSKLDAEDVVVVEHGYLKNQICSVFRMFYHNGERFFAGIQLDGFELRQCSFAPCHNGDQTLAEDFSKEFVEKKWWKQNGDLKFSKPQNKHKNRKNMIGLYEYKSKTNGKLNGLFLYTKCDIRNEFRNASVLKTAELIKEYFSSILNNQDAIQKWIEDNA